MSKARNSLFLCQGYARVMIYINFVELHFLMLNAKFQNHRPSGSEEEGAMEAILAIRP